MINIKLKTGIPSYFDGKKNYLHNKNINEEEYLASYIFKYETINDHILHDESLLRNNILFIDDINVFIANTNLFSLSSDALQKIECDSLLCSAVVPKKMNIVPKLKEKLSKKDIVTDYDVKPNDIDILDFSFPFDNKHNFMVYIVLIKNNSKYKPNKFIADEFNDIKDFDYKKLLFNLNLLSNNDQIISLIPQYIYDILKKNSSLYFQLPDFLNKDNIIYDLTNYNNKLVIKKIPNKYNDDLSLYLFISKNNHTDKKELIKRIMNKDDIIQELNNIK